ncbi:YdcF family protein [Paenibacillus sp. GXUN7292]|uniref:YdcF family protein n=1 Tax=Paenibacillus sp. GXUN7292 TaxID=3422499 RepID=UPI003D7E934F
MSLKKEQAGKGKKTSRSTAAATRGTRELPQKAKTKASAGGGSAEAKTASSKPINKSVSAPPAAARKTTRKRKAKKKKPSVLKKIFNTIIILCCLFLIWCGYLVWLMNNSSSPQMEHADAGIILGAALWRDQPSPALRERLVKAVELYEAGKVNYLVLSGGTGGLLSTISEAEGMRNFLIDKGIPEDKLLLESKSVNTFQNVRFSQTVMQEHGIKSSIIITHDYHLPRAMEIASYLKLESVQGASVHSKVLNPVYNQAREILALTKWNLEWLLLNTGILSPESIK